MIHRDDSMYRLMCGNWCRLISHCTYAVTQRSYTFCIRTDPLQHPRHRILSAWHRFQEWPGSESARLRCFNSTVGCITFIPERSLSPSSHVKDLRQPSGHEATLHSSCGCIVVQLGCRHHRPRQQCPQGNTAPASYPSAHLWQRVGPAFTVPWGVPSEPHAGHSRGSTVLKVLGFRSDTTGAVTGGCCFLLQCPSRCVSARSTASSLPHQLPLERLQAYCRCIALDWTVQYKRKLAFCNTHYSTLTFLQLFHLHNMKAQLSLTLISSWPSSNGSPSGTAPLCHSDLCSSLRSRKLRCQ